MKLQQTKDYLLLINKEAKIEVGDYVYQENFEKTNKLVIKIQKKFQATIANDKKGSYTKYKIIAYYPLTKEAKELDLPLLPEWEDDIDTVGKCANCGVEFHIHKPNQAKKFTIEDIEKAFEAGWQCKVNNGYKLDGTYYEDLTKFTKTLSTQQLPKEFIISEMEYLQPNIGHRESWKTVKLPLIKEFANSAILRYKTILNSEGRKVLVGKYKY